MTTRHSSEVYGESPLSEDSPLVHIINITGQSHYGVADYIDVNLTDSLRRHCLPSTEVIRVEPAIDFVELVDESTGHNNRLKNRAVEASLILICIDNQILDRDAMAGVLQLIEAYVPGAPPKQRILVLIGPEFDVGEGFPSELLLLVSSNIIPFDTYTASEGAREIVRCSDPEGLAVLLAHLHQLNEDRNR